MDEAHAKIAQMKAAEALFSRQLQEQRAVDDVASNDAVRIVSDKLRESQQQVCGHCHVGRIVSHASRCVQVRTLEQSFRESSQHLQQLQVHVLHIEEQAATYKLQTTEHIQRLQALHAEALSMKQQQAAAAATTAHLFVNDVLVAVGYVGRGERGAAGR